MDLGAPLPSSTDRRELDRVPAPAVTAATHVAMGPAPRVVRPLARPPGAALAPPGEASAPVPLPSLVDDSAAALDALLGARPANAPPVSVDAGRAAPVAIETFHAGVIADCIERAAMLARHRDERPLRERPRIEARLLAQIDAIAAAGASPDELVSWWQNDGGDDPWMIWPVAFALGSFEGHAPLVAAADLLESLPDDAGEVARLASEALVLAPHPHLLALARDLLRSRNALARGASVEVLSRLGQLDAEHVVALLDDPSACVLAAALRALARGFGSGDREPPLPASVVGFLNHKDREVCWETARLLTLRGRLDAYIEVRDGGPLADALGERALELLVWAGQLSDLGAMQTIVRRLPATPAVLDAVARFGHAGSWAYLVHYLGDDDLARAAEGALVTLFGQRVPLAEAKLPAAWRSALSASSLGVSPTVRYRRGAPWSVKAAAAELAEGDLTRRAIESRLDELRTRGAAVAVDVGSWGLSGAALRAAVVAR